MVVVVAGGGRDGGGHGGDGGGCGCVGGLWRRMTNERDFFVRLV